MSLKRDKTIVMRAPTKPLFKGYEIVAIVAFLAVAAVVSSLNLPY